MFDNDLDASILFTLCFLGSLVALVFFLAWLEQPASERWHPAWWRELVARREPVTVRSRARVTVRARR
jgi:hypothetical protein